MIKPKLILWAECPYCKILINGLRFYPLDIIDGYINTIKCPNDDCQQEMDVLCELELRFDALPRVK